MRHCHRSQVFVPNRIAFDLSWGIVQSHRIIPFMKRWRTRWLPLLAVLVVFTLVLWRAQRSGGACQQTDESKASYLCKLIAPANLPTDYLVIIGIGGVFVAIFTLESINVSAKAAQDAAEAAKLNAQAVINSERPYLIVSIHPDLVKPATGLFTLACLNQGNTPAKVIAVSAEPRVVNALDDLPIPPVYSTDAGVPQLDLIVHKDDFPIGHGINPEVFLLERPTERVLVHQARAFLVYYGTVVYRDMLYPESEPRGSHESQWCFVYRPRGDAAFDAAAIVSQPGTFVRYGPEGYNGYT
jgi:hypothetical protein